VECTESGEPGVLYIDPPVQPIMEGATDTVTVTLGALSNIYGIQITLDFDPSYLQVVGTQITPGTCPFPDFVVTNNVNNTTGTIDYAATSLSPRPPCDSGDVAMIDFHCLVPGSSPVHFSSSLISDPDGLPITHTTQDGTVVCELVHGIFLPMILK